MRRSLPLTLLVLLALPTGAQAHLVNSGLGPFYDGILHLLLSPGDLLGLIALALLAGLRGHRAGRLTALVMPGAWLLSGLVALRLDVAFDLPWLVMIALVVLGGLVAGDVSLPPPAVAFLAVMLGILLGLMNGSALAAIEAGPMSLFGIAASVLVLALLTSAAVVSLRRPWARIVVRVAGSWIAAIGILMFGWLMQGTG